MATIRHTITGNYDWNSNALTVSVSESGETMVFIHDSDGMHDTGSNVEIDPDGLKRLLAAVIASAPTTDEATPTNHTGGRNG